MSAKKEEDPLAYKASWVVLPPSEFDCTLWKRRKMKDKLVHLSRRLGVPEHDDDKCLPTSFFLYYSQA